MTTKRLPGTLDDFRRCPCGMDHRVIGKVERTPVIECPMYFGDTALRFVRGANFLITGTGARERETVGSEGPREEKKSKRSKGEA